MLVVISCINQVYNVETVLYYVSCHIMYTNKYTKWRRYFTIVVMGGTMGHFFFKPEKNLEFFRLKKCPIDAVPGKLE